MNELRDEGGRLIDAQSTQPSRLVAAMMKNMPDKPSFPWALIESAPKDGAKILIVRDGKVSIGWFDDDRYMARPKPFWSGSDAQLYGKSWARRTNPTHWAALPEPPK